MLLVEAGALPVRIEKTSIPGGGGCGPAASRAVVETRSPGSLSVRCGGRGRSWR